MRGFYFGVNSSLRHRFCGSVVTKSNIMKKALPILLICLCCLGHSPVSTAQPIIGYQTVTSGLVNPVDVVAAPGDSRLFIAQQNGIIRIWDGVILKDFINLSSVITPSPAGEQGLLSVVFHPDYTNNRYFFVWYTNAAGAVTLARYQRSVASADLGDPSTGQALLSIAKPEPSFTNHNGGKLNFGSDGLLYIGTGDGGSSGDPYNNAQSGASLLGKLLRIDVNSFATSNPFYNIPADNPFTSTTDGIRDEIYALGLRNPWRWSFDRVNGDLWLADVGQGAWEEVNWLPQNQIAGANFGWRCYEGAHLYNGGCSPAVTDTVSPVFEYGHNATTGGFSITGGYVYRGTDFPALQGYYITTDYITNNLWLVRPNGAGGFTATQQSNVLSNISSFGEGPGGELYAVRRSNGTLYKVIVTSVVPVSFSRLTATGFQGYNQVNWLTATENNTAVFYVECSTDGSIFNRVGQVTAKGLSTGSDYIFRHDVPPAANMYYRIVTQDFDGSLQYSEIVHLVGNGTGGVEVYPNVILNGAVNIVLYQPVDQVVLINARGSIVYTKNMRGMMGNIAVSLPYLTKGVYFLKVKGKGFVHNEKLIIQ